MVLAAIPTAHGAAKAMAARIVRPKPAVVTWVLYPAPVGVTLCTTRDWDGVLVALTELEALTEGSEDVALSTNTCGLY